MNVPKRIDMKTIKAVFVPCLINIAIIILPIGYIDNFTFLYDNDNGWIYKTVQVNLLLVLDIIIYLGYIAAIVISLLSLVRKTEIDSFLHSKYSIFLANFITFQVFGVLLTNSLIALKPISIQLGGFMQVATFLLIYYALNLRENNEKIKRIAEYLIILASKTHKVN